MDDFFSVDRIEVDQTSLARINELKNYFLAIETEIQRIESKLTGLKVEESNLDRVTKRLEVAQEQLEEVNSRKETLDNTISKRHGELNDIINQTELKIKQLSEYKDLSSDIEQLQNKKQDIITFNAQNEVDREEIRDLIKKKNALSVYLLNLEDKKNTLIKEINVKEKESLVFDRDYEVIKREIDKAKQYKLEAESIFEAVKQKEKEDDAKPGSVVCYIRKVQKKYPDLDLLNL
jgi:chromosome segregation ATPase